MGDNKEVKVLVYGDEAIDIHLLLENEIPEAVLNDKLNGQDIKMFTNRTGHKLIGDLITTINKMLSTKKGESSIDEIAKIEYLCSCNSKANYAYYIWKKNLKESQSSSASVYYKDQFIGAKFETIHDQDKGYISDEPSRNVTSNDIDIQDIDILIFYDRHYSSNEEDCKMCGDMNQLKPCTNNYTKVQRFLENSLYMKTPVIFTRTAGVLNTGYNNGEDEGTTKNIIKYINDHEKLRNNTIVLTRLIDLKELGAPLPVAYSWEDMIKNTYKELEYIRTHTDYATEKGIVSAIIYIVDFDNDGYASFDFSQPYYPCTVVYNKGKINGDGFKEISKRGSLPSSTSILQAIVANFMIESFQTAKNEGEDNINSEQIISNFSSKFAMILKICYLSVSYYCSKGRQVENKEFSINKETLMDFIQYAYKICCCENTEESSSNITNDNQDFIKKYMPGSIKLGYDFFKVDTNFVDVIIGKKDQSMYKICKSIVENGFRKIEIPYINFGELISIDRKEIISYRHIYTLMRHKLNSSKIDVKPLSFCVFGKPGSGKSFGVKEIAKYILNTPKEQNDILEFNLSQMNSIDDLCNAFVKISDKILTGKIPIVFWDEFDSVFNGKRYGWLKYFLAPMEDGKYFANNVQHNVGRCIFVFAGSSSDSWQDFVDVKYNEGWNDVNSDFSKITDFISRISGYIDVLGPNKDGENDNSYQLRRAVFIRKNIERYYKIGDEHFTIDEDVLRALLEVENYKHGNRSLSKLIEQFKHVSGEHKHIKKYCLPNQLDLYVDAVSFNEKLTLK